MATCRLIDVFIPRTGPRFWTYRGTAEATPGRLVSVPFGRSLRLGVVVSLHPTSDLDPDRLRDVAAVYPHLLLPEDLRATLAWMERYYLLDPARLFEHALNLSHFRLKQGELTMPVSRRKPPDVTWEPVQLTAMQQQVVEAVLARPRFHTCLLLGVTGSGKTEVYAELARRNAEAGKTVLVLAPEIALCAPLAERLARRSGRSVGIWHSALPAGERARVQRAIDRNELDILVGARSALFAPLPQPGLIIVDEAHDPSFQVSDGIGYHVRDAAIQRARYADAPIVLGTATPPLDLYHAARTSEAVTLLELPERIGAATLPEVRTVHLARPDERTKYTWLSRTLREAIEQRLERGEQTILYRNRRGYHPALLCSRCEHVVTCPDCSGRLTLHARPVHLRCHLCGHRQEVPDSCPECGAAGSLVPIGSGTQRLEEEMRQMFPDARIARLDRDQVTSGARVAAILDDVRDHRVDILIGTQMVTKGMDFPKVTLVGIVGIDGALNQPDIFASERLFQQLAQVAGRAGRHQAPGEVILQTWHPDHPVIRFALNHDVKGFLAWELEQRRAAQYPPFQRLLRVLVSGETKRDVESAANLLRAALCEDPELRVLGPAPAPIERIRRRWRLHLLARHERIQPLREAAMRVRAFSPPSRIRIETILDPWDLY